MEANVSRPETESAARRVCVCVWCTPRRRLSRAQRAMRRERSLY